MSANTIELNCQCGRTLAVPATAQGKIASCPVCAHQMTIPVMPAEAFGATPLAPPQVPAAMSFPQIEPDKKPVNPYAPVGSDLNAPGEIPDDVEAVRRYHLSHEASVKSMGLLFLLGAIAACVMGVFITIGATQEEFDSAGEAAFAIGLGVVVFVLGVAQFFTGLGLRRFNPYARIVAIVLNAISLLNLPVGTLVSVYFLYLLLSKKGQMVFSPQYQQIIAATPHVKYRTSKVVWIVAGLFALLVIALFALFARA